MKTSVAFLLLTATCGWSLSDEHAEASMVVAQALRWQYRWIENSPAAGPVECNADLFSVRSFVYCPSLNVSLYIERVRNRRPRVMYMTHEQVNYSEALARFERNYAPVGQRISGAKTIKVYLLDPGSCDLDRAKTESAAEGILDERLREKVRADGLTVAYPNICIGDPFYLLYFVRDRSVERIWKYEITPEGLELRWSYESGSAQRMLPVKAVNNLTIPMFWFRGPERR